MNTPTNHTDLDLDLLGYANRGLARALAAYEAAKGSDPSSAAYWLASAAKWTALKEKFLRGEEKGSSLP